MAQKTGGWLRNFFAPAQKIVGAVNDISFEIPPGELVGYLGPNGAGKSTTIKMLTGILSPTSGDVRVSGRVPWKQRREHVAHIGAVFGQRNTLWWDLPVSSSFDLLRDIYRIPGERYAKNMARFRDLLGLDEFMHTPVRSLSLGQLMRANLAAALVHDPDVLFLDEPTIGLDVVAKERIRQFITQINRERGVTVILTTHDLLDVEKLCDRVMMIDHGKLLFDGALAELQRRFGGERELEVDFAEPVDDASAPGARLIKHEGLRATYRFSREAMSASDLIGVLSARFRIADLSVREPQIEDTIRRIYEQQLLSAPLTPDSA
ncbi:MAG TPA: ATP-binding cassette domain-containing protein [Thermoflexales bacterium]|nr:ATP-binding cassette domain-containing protein [Thermoflexales bacterium]HQW35093.1 ATP-binding cassette domain-containing protein [Thermoflexales bacterium]HQX74950.1 ATP-binding cassette domain-containing protein [Thermoflexales bacterium]HQZ22944.1 ATP-binding cassette domain-containing protein [Thermoflexales bacterium]HQZ99696.1 ATP-binding cassette domain-containing protein [Thermoflexales bacterium]